MLKRGHTHALALAVCGLFSPAEASQEGVDMRLVDAGFIMRSADTPRKMELARRLPPRKFVQRRKDGRAYYVYADPDYCKCVLVGTPQALQAYRDMARPPVPPPGYEPPRGDNPEADVIEGQDQDFADLEPDAIIDYRF